MNKEEFINQLLALGIKLSKAKETGRQVSILDEAEKLYDSHKFDKEDYFKGNSCMYCEEKLNKYEAIVLCKKCTE